MMISAVIFILLGTLNLLTFLISRRKELLIFSVVFLCFGFVSLGAAMIFGRDWVFYMELILAFVVSGALIMVFKKRKNGETE